MNRIIKSVLVEMQYFPQTNFYIEPELEGNEQLYIAPYISAYEESTCYLVCSIYESTLLLLEEKMIISEIASAFRKTEFYKPDLDKNTSLILCVLKDQNAEKTKVYQRLIEDDPYYFKKHVLLFTEQEKDDFEISKQNATSKTYLEYIEKYLYSADNFNNYKRDPENNSLYQFMTNLATKIPIIPLKNVSNEALPVINDMFTNSKKELEYISEIEYCLDLLLSDESDLDDLNNIINLAEKLIQPYINLEGGLN